MKNRRTVKMVLALLLGGAVVAGVWAWSEQEPDSLGERIEDGVDHVTDQIDDSADAIDDAVDDVKDDIEDASGN